MNIIKDKIPPKGIPSIYNDAAIQFILKVLSQK